MCGTSACGTRKTLVIARYAVDHQACLITGDFGFADVRNYAPASYHGIVVLELPRDANAKFILNGLIEVFVQQTAILAVLPGQLAIVESGRIRLQRKLRRGISRKVEKRVQSRIIAIVFIVSCVQVARGKEDLNALTPSIRDSGEALKFGQRGFGQGGMAALGKRGYNYLCDTAAEPLGQRLLHQATNRRSATGARGTHTPNPLPYTTTACRRTPAPPKGRGRTSRGLIF